MPTQPGSPTFHGWRIVLVSFLALFVSVGFGFYSFGAFFVALTEEFGGGRTGVGVGLALFGITNGLVAPFLGAAMAVPTCRWIQGPDCCNAEMDNVT